MSHNTNQDPNGLKDDALAASSTPESIADGVDEEVVEPNRRLFVGWQFLLFAALAIAYSGFHLFSLNVYPMETWSFRIVHIAGALILGYGLFAGARFAEDDQQASPAWLKWVSYALLIPAVYSLVQVFLMQQAINGGAMRIDPAVETLHFGYPLMATTAVAIVLSWFYRQARHRFNAADLVLMVCALASAGYLLMAFNTTMRMSTGTSFAPPGISWAAIAGSLLILELTRRVAG
ncbi:MAG: C4-dicarboxylate ABC transporter permease, partial [Halomonas sp.]|nr:C4-dicarboxylate ABC transporter permease [Halomonas sp.]